MAAIQDESNAGRKISSFKPQYLDKIVFFMQLAGIAHNSKPLCSIKSILLLFYNIIVLSMNAMQLGLLIVTSWLKFSELAYFHQYLDIINRLVTRALIIYMIIRLVVLSRKSLLCSLPRPGHWQLLPETFERQTPLVRKTVFGLWFVVIIFVNVFVKFYFLIKPGGFMDRCKSMPAEQNQTMLIDKKFCYTSLTSLFIIVPSFVGSALVPFYMVLWIGYTQGLFKGVNDAVQNIRNPVDIIYVQKCKVQYATLCTLIEDINQHYGFFIAYYLFSMSFMLFSYGFGTIKALLSGLEIGKNDLATLMGLLTGSIFLFYFSFKLKSEVSVMRTS